MRLRMELGDQRLDAGAETIGWHLTHSDATDTPCHRHVLHQG